jgi:hypothetical protein
MTSERREVRVRVPGFERYKGYSDLIETYCCSATSCYFVEFPAIGYEGYFQKSDVEVKEVKKSRPEKRNCPLKKR